jgi:predicted aldo/keto reductase-like oxidoreductase
MIPELVPEFQRLVSNHRFDLGQVPLRKHTTYIAIRLIEEGLVKRKGISFHGEITSSKPLIMALQWIYYYFEKLKYLRAIHHSHSGGYKEAPPAPLPVHILLRYEDAGFVSIKDNML